MHHLFRIYRRGNAKQQTGVERVDSQAIFTLDGVPSQCLPLILRDQIHPSIQDVLDCWTCLS